MISQLKLEMNNLTRLVEAGAGLSIGEEATMNELLKQKEDLTKERDAQVLALSCIPPAMFSTEPCIPRSDSCSSSRIPCHCDNIFVVLFVGACDASALLHFITGGPHVS